MATYHAMQDEVSAVAVMAVGVAVAATSAVTAASDQKVARRAEAMIAVSAVLSNAVQSLVVSNATSKEVSKEENKEVKARNSASHAHLVSPASPVKAAAKSAHAVNVVNEAIETANNALPWTLPSKTLHWPTKQPWLQPWAAQQSTRRKMPHAVSGANGAANAVVATTDALSHVKIAKNSVMQHLPSKSLALT